MTNHFSQRLRTQFRWSLELFTKIINLFYKPFRGIIPEETFRYLFLGSLNTFLEAILYFIFYNIIFERQNLTINAITISPHIASFLCVFPIVFFTGFLFSRYMIFIRSAVKASIQFKRFGITIIVSLILHYTFLKILVEILFIYPTPSKILTSAMVALFTYLFHRHFTFKTNANYL